MPDGGTDGGEGGGGGGAATGGGSTSGGGGGPTGGGAPSGPGQLDARFGSGGVSTLSFAGCALQSARAAATQGTRVYLASNVCGAGAVLAVDAITGSLISTYGGGGRASLGDAPAPDSIVVQSDGTQTVGFAALPTDGGLALELVLARLDASGQAVTTFGVGGLLALPGSEYGDPLRLALDSNDRLYVVSRAESGSPRGLMVRRVFSTGLLDATWGDGGVAFVSHATRDLIPSSAVVDGARLIIGGTAQNPTTSTTLSFLARLESTGTADPAFGAGGVFISTNNTGSDFISRVAVQPDGKVIGFGTEGTSTPFLLRVTAAGADDPTFGTAGRTTIYASALDFAKDLALDSSGRVLVVGNGTTSSLTLEPWLLRYTSSGTTDPSFGSAGRAAPASVVVAGVTRAADGVLIFGEANTDAGVEIRVIRYGE